MSQYFTEYANIPTITPVTDKQGVPTGGTKLEGGEAVAIFDLNLDGIQDFVIVNGSPYYFIVLGSQDENGQYIYQTQAVYIGEEQDGLKNTPKSLGLNDFNNDGALDLYLNNSGRGSLQAKDPRDLENIFRPRNIQDAGLYRDAGFRTQINQGDGTFAYQDLNVDGDGTTRVSVFADFDSDGHLDAYLSNSPYFGIWWGGSSVPNQLYPGQADGTFGPNIIDSAVINDPGDLFQDELGRGNVGFKGVVVRDFDGDGKPDIIAGAYADIWDSVQEKPFGVSSPEGAAIDLDGDGLPDGGYQGDWQRGILVLKNISSPGNIQFEEVSNSAIDNAWGNTDQMHAYVTLPADIDNDGDLDLLASGTRNFTAHNAEQFNTNLVRVYRNDSTPGQIRFTNITEESGVNFMNDNATLPAPYTGGIVLPGALVGGQDAVAVPTLGAGAAIDIDNDGDVDWVMADRQTLSLTEFPNLQFYTWVFLNDGTGHFSMVSPEEHGLGYSARDLSYGDLNGDGRLDLVTVNGSSPGEPLNDNNYVFFNNIQNDNNYVFINVSQTNNLLGIGAKVTVYGAGSQNILGYEEVRTDFSYRSRRSTTLHFGLGQSNLIDVYVETQDGYKRTYRGLDVNRTHTLTVTDDLAGNRRGDAFNLGLLRSNNSPQEFSDWVGEKDPNDYYRFRLRDRSDVLLNLDKLSQNANVLLYDDGGNLLNRSANAAAVSKSISTTLDPGNYWVLVRAAQDAETEYELHLTAQRNRVFASSAAVLGNGQILGQGSTDNILEQALSGSFLDNPGSA